MQEAFQLKIIPERLRPVPKSYLFLQKLKKISSTDKKIRERWANLQKENKEHHQKKIKQVLQFQQIQKFQNDLIQRAEFYPEQQKVQRLIHKQQEKKREEFKFRKQYLENIYFKKKKRNPQPNIRILKLQDSKRSIQKAKTEGCQSPLAKESAATPLMLRKRSPKLAKKFDIINLKYREGLESIKKQGYISELKKVQSQKSMMNKIKGMSSFSTNQNQF